MIEVVTKLCHNLLQMDRKRYMEDKKESHGMQATTQICDNQIILNNNNNNNNNSET